MAFINVEIASAPARVYNPRCPVTRARPGPRDRSGILTTQEVQMSTEDATKPVGWSGKSYLSIDDLAIIQPGLARIMPLIGERYWKLYYAAKAGNWVMADFQLGEIGGLMELCMVTRPKYEEHLETFIKEDLAKVEAAIKAKDWNKVEETFREGVRNANDYHKLNDKGFIVWKLPDYPPPDLDLTPLED